MGYWDATDLIMKKHGGQGPPCNYCGNPMYPQDDHGRFACGCKDYMQMKRMRMHRNPFAPRQITDVVDKKDLESMTDEEKQNIPAINRLELPPTEAERNFLQSMLESMNADMSGDPEIIKAAHEKYAKARDTLDEKKKQNK